jgi:hypothetical protein
LLNSTWNTSHSERNVGGRLRASGLVNSPKPIIRIAAGKAMSASGAQFGLRQTKSSSMAMAIQAFEESTSYFIMYGPWPTWK